MSTEQYINLTELPEFKSEFLFDTLMCAFGPLSKINILVGANNSRKSRFIRKLLLMSKRVIIGGDTLQMYLTFHKAIDDMCVALAEYDGVLHQCRKGTDPRQHYHSQWGHIHIFQNSPNAQLIYREEEDQQLVDIKRFEEIRQFVEKYFFAPILPERPKPTYTSRRSNTEQQEMAAYVDYFSKLATEKKWMQAVDRDVGKRELFFRLDNLQPLFSRLANALTYVSEMKPSTFESDTVFIPVLRGGLPLTSAGATQPYFQTTSAYYFNGKTGEELKKDNRLNVFTGESLYDDILESRNSDRENRLQFEAFQGFVEQHFFPDQEIEIVARAGKTTSAQEVLVHIAGNEKPIHHLGDGIQSLLVMLFPIFMAPAKAWIFIDEPELSLHPGYQNLFIQTLLQNEHLQKKNLRYFFTTHSNHFLEHSLRSPESVSVFNFKYMSKSKSQIRCVHGDAMDNLDQLGVNNASVFMANCSIWVEGVTDRQYLQAFLKAYCDEVKGGKEFKEGLDYSFVEYAGSNLSHYYFGDLDEDLSASENLINSFRNANRIWLLADQDAGKEDKHSRLKRISKESQNEFVYNTTVVREVENLLPPEIIKEFIHKGIRSGKSIRKLERRSYESKGLGTVLSQKKLGIKICGQSGTLAGTYKKRLAQYVYDEVMTRRITWSDLVADLDTNNSLKKITESLYRFIKKNNPTTR